MAKKTPKLSPRSVLNKIVSLDPETIFPNIVSLLLFLFVITFIKSFSFAHFGLTMLTDDNQDFTAAMRINHGDFIYKGYQAFLPPLSDYFLALLLRINGYSYILSIYVYVFIVSFFPPLLYLLVKKVSNSFLAFVFSIGILFCYLRLDLLFFYTFFTASYLFAIRSVEKRSKLSAFMSGIFLMLGSLFRIDLAFFTGAGIFTLFVLTFLKTKEKKVVQDFIIFVTPVIVINLGVFIWLIHYQLLGFWIQDLLVGMIAKQKWTLNLFSLNNLLPSSLSLEAVYNSWNGWLYIVWIFVLIVGILYFVKKNKRDILHGKEIVLVALCVNLFVSLFYIHIHYDLPHFVKACMFFFPLLAAIILFPIKTYIRILAAFSFLGFFLVQLIFSIWFVHFSNAFISFPERGVYVFVNGSYIQNTTLPSKSMIQDAVHFLTFAKPNEKVFVLPYMSILYFISNRQNPTIYNNLLDGAMVEPFNQQYIISSLKKSKVKYIVYDRGNNPKEQTGKNSLKDYYPDLDAYIVSHYKVTKKNNTWLLMIKDE